MKTYFTFILGTLGMLTCGCRNNNTNDNVVSQRYIHKYGYAVSKTEWENQTYPGQVITTLRDGVTVTATYEAGMLHGPCTYTFPHSQTVESYYLYNEGNLAKEIIYDIKGMPLHETIHLSPTRYAVTQWYSDGTPMSIEEYANTELLEGQYFSLNNETESRVEKGNGLKICRDQQGVLLSKNNIERGSMVKQETFFVSGAPQSITYYADGKLNGEKRTFTEKNGEPLVFEEWVNGRLHGKSTFFMNGVKYLEISYLFGQKNGAETHYLDGEQISQEIQWENNKKHGPTTYYIDGIAKVEWYYDGKPVDHITYDHNYRQDQMIENISSEIRASRVR